MSDDSWSRGQDIKANNLPNTTVQIILTELSRFNMDFTEMLEYYEQLGASLIDARAGNNAGMEAIKKIPAEKLFTSISVMATLDYITNSFQGSSAGPIYEVLQALLAGGVVFGGKQAGADVLMGNKGELWLSNKNSQLSGKKSVTGQQSQKNIHALQVGETMWYIGFGKKGPAAKDQANKGRNTILRIFIVGINRVATADAKGSFNAVDADGTVVKTGLDDPGTDYRIPFDKVKADTIDIPIRPLPSVNFSQLASEAIDKSKDETQIAIRDIYVKLENIEKRTQTFLALHARENSSSSDKSKAAEAASLAATDYTNLKGDLKSGFGGVDRAAGAEFNEGKKITANFLKKLISESFKR
jgi:parvulin-like peptidyl-prolyl isomerase